uniref:Probable WRKY transcription factor protein 1 n=1 Tax=Nicotiana tabacum TaxID=4097 RepID=A0A1S3YB14_TOBAC|nr:PREDICTED: probable WRKY transcription factor protein 1 [Nicotiana tabacum]
MANEIGDDISFQRAIEIARRIDMVHGQHPTVEFSCHGSGTGCFIAAQLARCRGQATRVRSKVVRGGGQAVRGRGQPIRVRLRGRVTVLRFNGVIHRDLNCSNNFINGNVGKYMFNLHPSPKKNKKNTSKKIQTQRSEEKDEDKIEKDQAASSIEILCEKQKQKGDDFNNNTILEENNLSENSNRALKDNNVDNNSKLPMKEGKDVDYHVQQGILESTMLNSNNIIDPNQSPNENKEESGKEVIQNVRPPEQNGSKNGKEQASSFKEELPEKQQEEEDINGEFDLNVITSEDSLPNNSDRTLKDTNIDGGSKLPMRYEKDQDYYRLKQGIPRNIKFRSIIDIYKCSNRLSSPEEEYNWNRLSISQNKRSEVHNTNKTGKDEADTSKETLPEKQKQNAIQGDFESKIVTGEDSLVDNSNHTIMDNNNDNRLKLSTKDKEDQNYHINQRISKSTMFDSLIKLCEAIQNKRPEENNGSNTRKGQHVSSEEELDDQQEEEEKDINGEFEVNRVTREDRLPDNFDYNANSGSKLLTRDEKDKKYYITQGIPRSIKFRSMTNLYKYTTRLSPVEDEYNWNLPIGENPNMSIRSTKEDSSIKTNKENVGYKRKLRDNQKGKGEKDVTTSSTSKVVNKRSADDSKREGNTAEKTSSPNTIRSHK